MKKLEFPAIIIFMVYEFIEKASFDVSPCIIMYVFIVYRTSAIEDC